MATVVKELNISIKQNSRFRMRLRLRRGGALVDLTDHVFYGQIRKTATDAAVLAVFSFESVAQTGDNLGVVFMVLPGATSLAMPVDKNKTAKVVPTLYRYDVISIDANGAEMRWVEGTVSLSPATTRVNPAVPVTP